MRRKFLSVFITVIMAVTLFPFVGASSEVHAYNNSINASEVVDYMNGLVGQPNNYVGYCLLFVTKCWENMGFEGSYGWGNATHFAAKNTVSTSKDNIPIGADVYFTSPDGNGHIGIYVGDGYFVHAGSKSVYEKSNLSESYYGSHFTGWGWHPNVAVIANSEPIEIPLSEATITVPDATYTGKKLTPKPVVTYEGQTLVRGTDYKCLYKNNKDIGLATVTITGIGNCKGSIKANFKIIPKGVSISKLSPAETTILAIWKPQLSKPAITGYQIGYSESSDMSEREIITVKGRTKVSKIINKLKSCTTYYVQLRTYKKVGRITYYSNWSEIKETATIDANSFYMEKVVKYLKANNWKAAKKANAKLDKYANEECVINMTQNMKNAYREILERWNKSHSEGHVLTDYYLTDFDNDGEAELLVQSGDCTASTFISVYDYANSNAVCLGYFGHASNTLSAYPNHYGVISVYEKMGYWSISQCCYSSKGTVNEYSPQGDMDNHLSSKTLYDLDNVFNYSERYFAIGLKLCRHSTYVSNYGYKMDYSPFE